MAQLWAAPDSSVDSLGGGLDNVKTPLETRKARPGGCAFFILDLYIYYIKLGRVTWTWIRLYFSCGMCELRGLGGCRGLDRFWRGGLRSRRGSWYPIRAAKCAARMGHPGLRTRSRFLTGLSARFGMTTMVSVRIDSDGECPRSQPMVEAAYGAETGVRVSTVSPFSTYASSQPRTRFQPSLCSFAEARLPANPSCKTRTRVPVPDFRGPLG